MPNTKAWLSAFRFRTLPLAISGIGMGIFLALADGVLFPAVAGLSVLTALLLQILSNLANDYGDSSHGVDNENRIGPARSVQSGEISKSQMKKAVILFSVLSLISGSFLLIVAFTAGKIASMISGIELSGYEAPVLFILGIAAIFAAIRYTIGKNPYGYAGFGDLFVFLFFGWVSVGGSYYLNTLYFDPLILLPASGIGLFSTGVLNLNNLRDHENDARSGKKTLVIKIGYKNSRYYHIFLIIAGLISFLIFSIAKNWLWYQYAWILLIPLFLKNIQLVVKTEEPALLDPGLKQLAISTFIFSLVYGFLATLS